MGWVYGFHSLNPVVISELASLAAGDIRQRLIQGGIAPEQVGVENWDDDLDENEALTLLATTREWDVDKSLDDIRAIASLEPEMAPVVAALREMESFSASGLAARFHSRETGLMGITIPATLAAAASAVGPFITAEGRKRLTSTKPSLVQRLLGGGVRGRLSHDYLWQHWANFGQALQFASERGEWLGLHMS